MTYQHKDMLVVIIIVLVLYSANRFLMTYGCTRNTLPQTLYVSQVEETTYRYKITGRKGLCKTIVYAYHPVKIGDIITVDGKHQTLENPTIPGGFNYQDYLKSQGVIEVIDGDKITVNTHLFHPRHIHEGIKTYIDRYLPRSKRYINTFILADTSEFDEQTKTAVTMLGISHLFAVSGMHIGLLVVFLNKGGTYLNLKESHRYSGIMVLLSLYMIITGFSPSVVRASLMTAAVFMTNIFKVKLSSLDILSGVFILLLMMRPYYYLSIGFQLSFLVTFFLIITYDLTGKMKGIHQLLLSSTLAFLITVPLIIQMNYTVNIMTILVNIIMIPLTTLIIVPLGYLTFVMPFLDGIYSVVTALFDTLIVFLSEIFYIPLSLSLFHPLAIILYYIFLYLTLTINIVQHKALMVMMGVFCFTVFFYARLQPFQDVVFLDIAGESTVFKDRFDQCNIVIDTGKDDDYDSLVSYLKRERITKIDYLIVSHFHADHYGETEDLIDILSVKHLITNETANAYENRLIPCGNFNLFIYPITVDDENENNQSLPISSWAQETHYFFFGDAEKEAEEIFNITYSIDVDVFKVSHHGSDTSSTMPFLQNINPESAIINVDRNNTR